MTNSFQFTRFIQKYGMPLALLLFILILQGVSGNKNLLAWQNIKTIMLQASVLGFIALGLSFVMIAGETDISFAGTMGMMSASFTLMVTAGMGYFSALFLTLLIGALCGFLIALLVTKAGFSGFIVSIGFMFMGLGIERSFNEGITIWLKEERVARIGQLELGGIFVFGWILLLLYAAAYLVIQKTKLGFSLRITGENPQAGREVGINEKAVRTAAFVIAGVFFGLSASAEPIRYGGSIVGAGQGYLLPALAACFLGSTMFNPGRVNVFGSLIGSVFMILISNFMQLLSLAYYFTPLVQGIVLIIAVGISVINNKGKIQQVKV
jgi:ribose/xylose/arabinose/galactoside ABC-type transport system permease subunit